MRVYFLYTLIIVFVSISSEIAGQSIQDKTLFNDSLSFIMNEKNDEPKRYNFSLFDGDFNLFSFERENLNFGINTFFEEDLPEYNKKVNDFFMYNLGVNFFLNQFRVSLFFENFFNISSKELSIAPAYIEQTNSLVYLEHDTPSMIHLSLVYNF